MSDLINRQCQACTDLTEKINSDDAAKFLEEIENWHLHENGLLIYRNFKFKNFKETMFFINAIAFICEYEGHHPDVKFGYNYCEVCLTTHSINGLTENDFICAAKINKILSL
jgi:4a-hydroxytetrahydrobiopterin dehydratase